jgi:dipeptidyl aminopeptidase/acylaminoacyl peptidase
MNVRSLTAAALALGLALPAPAIAKLSPNNEWGGPAHPTGYALVIHGGGWLQTGKQLVVAARGQAAFFQSHGWKTYNVDYRPGSLAEQDVVSAYDLVRQKAGRLPVIAWGGSAGGHLALMLAAARPSLNGVIAEGAPTNLVSLPHQTANGSKTGPFTIFARFVVPSFGTSLSHLRQHSPAAQQQRIHARVLLGSSTLDYLVSQAQMNEMAHARRMLLTGQWTGGNWLGRQNFTHAGITAHALGDWQRAELTLMAGR